MAVTGPRTSDEHNGEGLPVEYSSWVLLFSGNRVFSVKPFSDGDRKFVLACVASLAPLKDDLCCGSLFTVRGEFLMAISIPCSEIDALWAGTENDGARLLSGTAKRAGSSV